jgi:hypothetical protein
MRRVILLGAAALAVTSVATAVAVHASTRAAASPGCGHLAGPTSVRVRRTEVLAGRANRQPLDAISHDAAVVRRLYDDMCVIVTHPAHIPNGAMISCPADFGLSYSGAFFTGTRELASFVRLGLPAHSQAWRATRLPGPAGRPESARRGGRSA